MLYAANIYYAAIAVKTNKKSGNPSDYRCNIYMILYKSANTSGRQKNLSVIKVTKAKAIKVFSCPNHIIHDFYSFHSFYKTIIA